MDSAPAPSSLALEAKHRVLTTQLFAYKAAAAAAEAEAAAQRAARTASDDALALVCTRLSLFEGDLARALAASSPAAVSQADAGALGATHALLREGACLRVGGASSPAGPSCAFHPPPLQAPPRPRC